MKRRPSPDDPTLRAGAPKRRRNVRLLRAAIVVYIAILAFGVAAPWLDRDDGRFVPLFGVDEPHADVQVEAVRCLVDASSHLNLTATIVNNTDLDYTVTLRALITAASNVYDSEERVHVPARSSNAEINTFTGLTDPATRCELTVVKREQFPEAFVGGSIP